MTIYSRYHRKYPSWTTDQQRQKQDVPFSASFVTKAEPNDFEDNSHVENQYT